jgi:dodecin
MTGYRTSEGDDRHPPSKRDSRFGGRVPQPITSYVWLLSPLIIFNDSPLEETLGHVSTIVAPLARAADKRKLVIRAVRINKRETTIMTENVYKVIELVGTSTESWEKATAAAINRAGKTLRDLRVAEVVKLDVQLKNGKVEAYRSRISVSFKYENKQ